MVLVSDWVGLPTPSWLGPSRCSTLPPRGDGPLRRIDPHRAGHRSCNPWASHHLWAPPPLRSASIRGAGVAGASDPLNGPRTPPPCSTLFKLVDVGHRRVESSHLKWSGLTSVSAGITSFEPYSPSNTGVLTLTSGVAEWTIWWTIRLGSRPALHGFLNLVWRGVEGMCRTGFSMDPEAHLLGVCYRWDHRSVPGRIGHRGVPGILNLLSPSPSRFLRF